MTASMHTSRVSVRPIGEHNRYAHLREKLSIACEGLSTRALLQARTEFKTLFINDADTVRERELFARAASRLHVLNLRDRVLVELLILCTGMWHAMGKQAPDGDQLEELSEPSIGGMRELLSTLERPENASLQRELRFELNKVREMLWKLELKMLHIHMGNAEDRGGKEGDGGGAHAPQVNLLDEDWEAELDDSDDGLAFVLSSPRPPNRKYSPEARNANRLNSSQINSIERNLDYILLHDKIKAVLGERPTRRLRGLPRAESPRRKSTVDEMKAVLAQAERPENERFAPLIGGDLVRVRERILEEELAQVAVNPAMRKMVEAERLYDTCRECLLEAIKGYSRRALERAIDDFKDTLDMRDTGERESLLLKAANRLQFLGLRDEIWLTLGEQPPRGDRIAAWDLQRPTRDDLEHVLELMSSPANRRFERSLHSELVRVRDRLQELSSRPDAVHPDVRVDIQVLTNLSQVATPSKPFAEVIVAFMLMTGVPEAQTRDWNKCRMYMRPYGVSDRGELNDAGPVEFRAPNPAQRGAPGVVRRLRRLDLRELSSDTVAKATHHLNLYEHHDIHLANHELNLVYEWTRRLIEQFYEHCSGRRANANTNTKTRVNESKPDAPAITPREYEGGITPAAAKNLSHILASSKPLHDIVKGVFILLGEPEEKLDEWKNCKRLLRAFGGFDTTEGAFVPGLLSRIERFDSASLDVTRVLRAEKYIELYDEKDVHLAAREGALLHHWARRIISNFKHAALGKLAQRARQRQSRRGSLADY